ncbi:uncharacterized protein (DUF305 family) [Dietzia kunjamensis]|uniref:DUF305 domain-containing protein n=2 Tax=Dietzia kunjamensis TaxID=322509 RepID=UPI0005BD34D6|nr:DUF305 domain-containing protein [Dietzia kunjamensis]MBB1011906.1 DUF305 domain-containing protein [Dietzia kunjamensis]RKE54712.1 uncharacterized protein (DUF305 family) [Dietzia kunjamensis]
MNRKKLVMTAAAAAVLLGLSACTSDETDTASETTTAVETTATSGSSTTEQAEESAQHSEADVMFAQMMIPHHEQAIEMSDIILSKDDVPADVTSLAEEIKAAQGPEIAQLTDWLEQWGEPTQPEGMDMDMDMGGDHDMAQMEGMLSDEELQQLSDAPGPEAAELFLNQMIAHHEGAVAMAEDQVENGTYPPAVDLAQTIIDTQQQEIDTMRQLLDPM